MNIVEIITTIMLFCGQVPDQCQISEDVEQKTMNIVVCSEDITASRPIFNFGVIDIDNPENHTKVRIDTSCVSI